MATQSLSAVGVSRGFFPTLWRAIRQLFHEVTGTLFFAVALSGASAAWRIWRQGASHWVIAVTAAYAFLMAFFGVFSFRDARRIVIRPSQTR